MDGVLAHERGLDAARDGPAAHKAGEIAEERRRLGAGQANGFLQQEARLEDVAAQGLAAVSDEGKAFAQHGQGAVEARGLGDGAHEQMAGIRPFLRKPRAGNITVHPGKMAPTSSILRKRNHN